MPKIRKMLLNLEGFKYATPLEFSMGYYYIHFSDQASNLCTIIIPRGKYWYKRLPMGVSNSTDIFQDKIKMLRIFEFIRAYTNELLIITKGDWSDHVEKLERTLQNIKDNGTKCNIENSFFGQTEIGYLGFWVT